MLEILPVDGHIFSLETTARCLWNPVNFDFYSNSVVFNSLSFLNFIMIFMTKENR
jgi:hypothetical protein